MLHKRVKCEFCGTPLIIPGCYMPMCYVARGKMLEGLAASLSSSEEPTLYDAVDCPVCGKQLILGVRERTYATKKLGEWVEGTQGYYCSKCDYIDKEYYDHRFCPNCGVKMKGSAE